MNKAFSSLTDLTYTPVFPILRAQDWRQPPFILRLVCFWKMCTTGDGEIFTNGGRGDHSNSPVFNNKLHKEKVNSWYTGTIITAVTSQ